MMNFYFHPFVLPFSFGVLFLLVALIYKYAKWLIVMPAKQKRELRKAIFSKHSLGAIKDVISESLLHRKIFATNPVLGYMHMSLAFGWFLLIVVGWLETSAYLKDAITLPYVDIFFRYFFPDEIIRFEHSFNYAFLMDALLLFILIGVALAYSKRIYSRMMGMRRTTKHVIGDKIALSALWLIFPLRLLAEGATCGIHDSGSFLTNNVGHFMASFLPLESLELPLWWAYSIALGVFFVALVFSRYLHIFAEIPHIFLKRYNIRSGAKESVIDKFQIAACSRCGICIDPCQMQSAAGINDMQAVYYLRDRRYHMLEQKTADNCLMCGRCEQKCPVGIDLNTIRLNRRTETLQSYNVDYKYLNGTDKSVGSGKVGYFAGCMTLLSPKIMESMKRIFESAQEAVWYADSEGGSCCGRPMRLAGDLEGAAKMAAYNKELFLKHDIDTLVTSCPICLKTFKEEYDLQGIRVLHHSEYILELIESNRLIVKEGKRVFAYHDPCELGRGGGVYDAPRSVLHSIGSLTEVAENRESGLCCGGSLGNSVIEQDSVTKISVAAAKVFEGTGADTMVTSCPLCKKTFSRATKMEVMDIAEVVAGALS